MCATDEESVRVVKEFTVEDGRLSICLRLERYTRVSVNRQGVRMNMQLWVNAGLR